MRMESPLNQRLRRSPPDVVYTPIDVTSPEYLPGYCHLSKLKHQPPGMPHQMSTHLDELGLHASTPGLQTSAVESVTAQEAGVASGLYSTNRYLGSVLGSAILAGLLSSDRSDLTGLDTVFAVVLGAALLSTVAALGLRPRPDRVSVARGFPGTLCGNRRDGNLTAPGSGRDERNGQDRHAPGD